MHWIDWLIVLVPLAIVGIIGFKTQKYVKGVSDFLTAGRVAGRYVICVAGGEATMGLISLVAYFEAHYKSGFAYSFWGALASPLGMVMALTGFCYYRYRETRAMTLGQFLEIRYSRSFRIFAAFLQVSSGIINYGLFPAVGARFIVYYCRLPLDLNCFGYIFPTFAVVMAIFLLVAVFVSCMGGQITIIVTDCVQGLLSYPIYAIIVAYIMFKYSWFRDMEPVIINRPAGESFINPFDIQKLRDFNLFYVLVGFIGMVVNRMGWSGTQGYLASARNAHEQKMGGILGAWRSGFANTMFILLALVAFMFLNNARFENGEKGSIACRRELAIKAFSDVGRGKTFEAARQDYKEYVEKRFVFPKQESGVNSHEPGSISKSEDQQELLTVGSQMLGSISKKDAQVFDTIYKQMRVPIALRYVLPVGLVGLFCAICIFLLISTDTTYLHSWSSIIVQDLILPIRGKPFTPRQQLALLRILIACVGVFGFFFSYFFGQIDYILMFFAVTGAIWLGGSGICIVGGLYWKRGTTAGAWTALITGSVLAVGGILCQHLWVETIYPWISQNGLLDLVTRCIEGASAPLEPIIRWRVTPQKFPINSQEIYAISMISSISLYIVISLLTCREPYNIDRMLHRGKYRREGIQLEKQPWTIRTFFTKKLLSITEEYSTGDKVIAWSVFLWSFVRGFLFFFLGVVIWNQISSWPAHWWSIWYFICNFVIACFIGTATTIWFVAGGMIDLIKLFRDLRTREVNILDDGRVIEHVSADDVSNVEKLEHVKIGEAHVEEQILREELEAQKDTDDLENLGDHTD